MMDIESQVCSLELAIRLKELGVKQESLFIWFHRVLPEEKWVLCHNNLEPILAGKNCNEEQAVREISAFTIAELLSILPHRVTLPKGEPYNSFRFRMEKGIWCIGESASTNNPKFTEYYSVNYYCDTTSQEMDWLFNSLTKNISDENPANALAKMLIYLLENKLI